MSQLERDNGTGALRPGHMWRFHPEPGLSAQAVPDRDQRHQPEKAQVKPETGPAKAI